MSTTPNVTDELYRVAVGPEKADYYVPLFHRFDAGGSRISWNWPTLFVAFFWMVYRKMYGLAAAYMLLWPIVLLFIAIVLMMILGETAGGMAYWVLVVGSQFVLLPMFANALYHRHIRRKIDKLSAGGPTHEELVQRLIGAKATGSGAFIVVVAVFGVIFVLGILAAIAIPAYQDYTIRAQVTEGLNIASSVRAAVAESYEATQELPADNEAAGLTGMDLGGKYVESIQVSDGAVSIRYGNAANSHLAGLTLSLYPVMSADDFEWHCGYNLDGSEDASVAPTDVPQKYLPTSCREPSTT